MYIIPSEINSETKIFKNVYLIDMLFMLVAFVLTMSFSSIVNPKVVVPYYICSFVLTIFLVLKSQTNPGLRNYKAIYLMIIRCRWTYQSLDWNTEREG
ncbi:hypothetical protein JGS6364_PCS1200331 (plasmid) [[Clostridium] sordellii]|uniref:DUF5592 family protein n=1 Tax=Paraclostridium sordellii TaxID=1505 RepID=UPI000540AF72|nr:DUF5592 family protein [Paeniclostridium sordellii]CEK32642.1 hypothetical protein JGS6364_PCS1200331 (plasmid) [[Clostridium] sordellii] [Paeniclostridium sordellii]